MFMAQNKQSILRTLALFILLSGDASSEMLRLGETQLTGKKDQPEAMTFVSRTPVELQIRSGDLELIARIKEEVNGEIFSISLDN